MACKSVSNYAKFTWANPKRFVFKTSCKSTFFFLTWYTSIEALKALEGITLRLFKVKNIYHSLCFHTISTKPSEETEVSNQRIKIILFRVYKRNFLLSFKYTDFNIDCFYFWRQDKRVMPFTYISSITIHHCRLLKSHQAEKTMLTIWNKISICPQPLTSVCNSLPSNVLDLIYIKRIEARSVLILKHLETKRETITGRTKGCITKNPPEDL